MYYEAEHPGKLVSRTLLQHDLSVSQAASLLHVARPGFNNLVNERRAMTTNMALRLERLFGINASEWLRLQVAYDIHHAKIKHIHVLAEIKRMPQSKVT